MASAPCAARTSPSLRATRSRASSHVAGTSSPSRRTSGVVRRSGWPMNWNPYRPLTQRFPCPGPLADLGRDLHDAAVPDLELDRAAAAAERADGVDGRRVPGASLEPAQLVLQGARRTGRDAVAAELAVGLDHGAPERGRDDGVETALGHVEDVTLLHLVADSDAAPAEDALGRVVDDERRVLARRDTRASPRRTSCAAPGTDRPAPAGGSPQPARRRCSRRDGPREGGRAGRGAARRCRRSRS